MIQIFELHQENPNKRDVSAIADAIKAGKLAIIPTDTMYALVCTMSNRATVEKLIQVTGKQEKKAKLSLICKDISTVAGFTMPIDNHVFKTMKRYTPGPYTFILNANNYTQKFFKNSRQEIGIRIVEDSFLIALHEYLDEPLMGTTLNKKGDEDTDFTNPEQIASTFKHDIDIFVHHGVELNAQSTILDCTGSEIELVRLGIGEVD